jgi:hypothetical protein
MNSLAITFTLCFLAVYSVGGAHSLMCYNCTYVKTGSGSGSGLDIGINIEVGKACGDPFDAEGMPTISCDGSCVVRMGEGSGLTTTQRGCSTADDGQCFSAENVDTGDGGTFSQSCCTDDLCNGAGLVGFSLALVMATLFGALYAKY